MARRKKTDRSALFQKFTFGDKITEEQVKFYQDNGFIHFEKFLTSEKVNEILSSIKNVEDEWIKEGRTKVNGIPIKFGMDENGKKMVQRFAFSSLHSEYLHKLLADKRFDRLKAFIGDDSRIAEQEKDGLVINHFVNTGESQFTKLGWHTDGLRDLFNHLHIEPMLNIGIHLDDCPPEKGGLRILPGTHNQNIYDLLFRKRYFLDNTADEEEFTIETKAGDLTVHSGRIWHRVALATVQGAASRRRVMYFPIIKGKYKPKSEKSWTPIYHKFQKLVR